MSEKKKWIQAATSKMEKKGTKGAFSGWAKRHGMSTRMAIQRVLASKASKKKYGSVRVKQALFARNVMR